MFFSLSFNFKFIGSRVGISSTGNWTTFHPFRVSLSNVSRGNFKQFQTVYVTPVRLYRYHFQRLLLIVKSIQICFPMTYNSYLYIKSKMSREHFFLSSGRELARGCFLTDIRFFLLRGSRRATKRENGCFTISIVFVVACIPWVFDASLRYLLFPRHPILS